MKNGRDSQDYMAGALTASAPPAEVITRSYTPRPPLSEFVDLFWFESGYDAPHPKERLLPTGTVSLVFDLGSHKTVFCGAHSEFFVIDTPRRSAIIGIHFKPGGAFPFLKSPANQLHNTVLPLETLWGTAASSLRDRLLAAETIEARFQLLEQALLAQISRPLDRHPAVAFGLKVFQRVSQPRPVSEVIEQTGLSQRRFIQRFSEEVGLTPKLFCRVQRFQEALHRVAGTEEVDWADVALSCGYFDQAHFIHDFQAFSGLTPTTYLARRCVERLNHVPLYE
jgi:AraC-like DNA-binding protein